MIKWKLSSYSNLEDNPILNYQGLLYLQKSVDTEKDKMQTYKLQ